MKRLLFCIVIAALLINLVVAGTSCTQKKASISYSPASLSFTATQEGNNPPIQAIGIWNSGGDTLSWSVNDDAPWLNLSPTNGNSTGGMSNVIVSVNISALTAGSYTGFVTISAPEAENSPQTIPVTLTLATPRNEYLNQTLYDNSWDINISNSQADFRARMGERFNSWPAGVIKSVDCCLLKRGLPSGTFYVRVRRVSDDAILGTLGSKVTSSLTNSYAWYTFNSPVVIDTTEDIRISLEWDGGNSSNYINSPVYMSDIYSGGMLFEYNGSYSDYSWTEWTWRNLTYSILH